MKVKKFRTLHGWISATLYAMPLAVNIPLQSCFLWVCMKALEDEQSVVINAYTFTVFERLFCIIV